jgi:hypothetical protein
MWCGVSGSLSIVRCPRIPQDNGNDDGGRQRRKDDGREFLTDEGKETENGQPNQAWERNDAERVDFEQ